MIWYRQQFEYITYVVIEDSTLSQILVEILFEAKTVKVNKLT